MSFSPDALKRVLAEAGYGFCEPPILQDAEVFLDLAGEDLRRRLFLVGSADGVDLCLRPDFTIPVCLHHLTSGPADRRGDYAYLGPVFRQRPGETGEFQQAGVESIGRTDTDAADAEMLALALDAARTCGFAAPEVRVGDSGLFAAVLESLALPEVWRRRLARAFGDRKRLDLLLAKLAGETDQARPAYAGFLAALDGTDHAAARQVVDDLFSMAGITPVGGRTAAEIAERFLEQAALQGSAGQGDGAVQALRAFLQIAGDPVEAEAALRDLAVSASLAIAPAIDRFRRRNEGMAKSGIDFGRLRFSADFGRRLDYYTGFVFEIYDPDRPGLGPIVGGGRYDRLLSLIVRRDGSGEDIPAIGFALWLDRIATAKGGAAAGGKRS